jgi:hypothetical protein
MWILRCNKKFLKIIIEFIIISCEIIADNKPFPDIMRRETW